MMCAHGKHKNLSCFAFTATPKDVTPGIFGTRQRNGAFRPFHTYSMRQAIEEGFIHDQRVMEAGGFCRDIKDLPVDAKTAAGLAHTPSADFLI